MGGGYFGSIYFGQYSPGDAPAIEPSAALEVGRLGAEVYAAGVFTAWVPDIISERDTTRVNQLGSFEFRVSAFNVSASALTAGREVRIIREGEGEVFRGIIDNRQFEAVDGPTLVITGSSLGEELTWPSTYNGIPADDLTPAQAMAALLADATGWSALDSTTSPVNVTDPFVNQTPFRALNRLAETQDGYVRETATAREIELKNTIGASGIRLVNVEQADKALLDNALIGLITSIKHTQEGGGIINRIVPLGAENGELTLDLSQSDRSSPYTIESFVPRAPTITNSAQWELTAAALDQSVAFDCVGENRFIIIAMLDKTWSGDSIKNVRVNGKVATVWHAAGATLSLVVWYVTNPNKGRVQIDAQWDGPDGPSAGMRAIIIGLKDVDQIDPIRANTTGTSGTSTTPSLLVNTAVTDLVLDFLVHANATATVGAGQTVVEESDTDDARSSQQSGDASSVTMSWALGSSVAWMLSVMAVKAATVYYIEDATSVTAYGGPNAIPRVQQLILKASRLVGAASAQLIASANTLYDVAATHLQKVKDPIDFYDVAVTKLPTDWLVGDSMHLTYAGVAETAFGGGRATNRLINGGFETDTTGWQTSGTNAIARVTSLAKFGSASLEITYGNTVTVLAERSVDLLFTEDVPYNMSCWIYIPTAWDGTGDLELVAVGLTGVVTNLTVTADLTKRDQWQRIHTVFTAISGGLLGNAFRLRANGGVAPTVGRKVYIDGCQIELGSTPTPYIETDGAAASADVQGRQTWLEVDEEIPVLERTAMRDASGVTSYRLKLAAVYRFPRTTNEILSGQLAAVGDLEAL